MQCNGSRAIRRAPPLAGSFGERASCGHDGVDEPDARRQWEGGREGTENIAPARRASESSLGSGIADRNERPGSQGHVSGAGHAAGE